MSLQQVSSCSSLSQDILLSPLLNPRIPSTSAWQLQGQIFSGRHTARAGIMVPTRIHRSLESYSRLCVNLMPPTDLLSWSASLTTGSKVILLPLTISSKNLLREIKLCKRQWLCRSKKEMRRKPNVSVIKVRTVEAMRTLTSTTKASRPRRNLSLTKKLLVRRLGSSLLTALT